MSKPRKEFTENFSAISRITLYKIFNKLSTEDLLDIIKVYTKLDIQGPCVSFAIEILQDRGVLD